MKKRAVLFLLVLVAVLCLALPVMATEQQEEVISTDRKAEQAIDIYNSANEAGKTILWNRSLDDVDMEKLVPLNVTLKFADNRAYVNDKALVIGPNGTLSKKVGVFPVVSCPIINYGTITDGIYTDKIINYGTITGGTFTGTVINATDPTNSTKKGCVPSNETQTADLSEATLQVMDADNYVSSGEDDSSFAGAYITVTLKLANDESITGSTELTKKIRRGSKIWTNEPTRSGDPETTSTVFAYWRKDGSTGTNDVYAHDHFCAPGSQITVTPVWCDHVVVFDANPPETDILQYNWMLPMAFYRETGGQCLSENLFQCYNKMDGNPNTRMWFGNWNTRKDGKGFSYPAGEGLIFTPDFQSDQTKTTIYARWTSRGATGGDQTIIYQREEGSKQTVQESASQGNTGGYTLRPNMFEPERGKEFIGWKVEEIEPQSLLQPGDKILIVVGGQNPTTITAQWRPLPVTEITFDPNGSDVTGETGTGNKETYYKDETLPLPENGFARKDYTFTGWNTRPDGTGTGYGDGGDITITGDELVGQKVTLYAQWESHAKPETPTPTPTQRPVPPTTQPTNPPPQTGDASNQPLWLALCMASVAAMAALVVMKKRRFFQR